MAAFVQWSAGNGGTWCKLGELELEHESFDGMEGVYGIWQDSGNPLVLRVGQGPIRDCLTKEQRNPQLSAYRPAALFVTWAPVNPVHRADVARYLAAALKPTLGQRYPEGKQIKVNLPYFSRQTSAVCW